METGSCPDGGVFVAADVHYLASGSARAAAVVAADAGFSRLVADRVELAGAVAVACTPPGRPRTGGARLTGGAFCYTIAVGLVAAAPTMPAAVAACVLVGAA
jgi:hypothetical protein